MANKEVIKKWVDALRSGEYEQGHEYLCKDDQYCCLGVLCDLAEREGIVSATFEPENEFEDEDIKKFGQQKEFSALPEEVREWSGLPANPVVDEKAWEENDRPPFGTGTVTHLNDDLYHEFEDIADILERKYLTGE